MAIVALWATFPGFHLINTNGKRRERTVNFIRVKMLVPRNSDPQGRLPRGGGRADRRSVWGRPGTIQKAVREVKASHLGCLAARLWP